MRVLSDASQIAPPGFACHSGVSVFGEAAEEWDGGPAMSVLLVPGEDLLHFPRRHSLIFVLLVPTVWEAVGEVHAEVLCKVGSAILNGSVSSLTASLSVGLASGLTVSSGVPGGTGEAEKRGSPPPSPCSRGAVRGVPRD